MEQEEIIQIFNEIDKAINFGLSKKLCTSFIERYEAIKKRYLGSVKNSYKII